MRIRSSRAFAVLVCLAVAACGRGSATPPPPPPPDVVKPTPRPVPSPTEARVQLGQKLFANLCALCHGPDGRGYVADNAPSLVSESFLASASDAFLRTGIVEGRPGTAMGAYGRARGGPLSDGDVDAVIAFLRAGKPEPMPAAATATAGDATRGKATYTSTCKECHGDPAARGKAPYLANPVFLASASDAFLRHAIVNGRADTEMKPFGATLDAQAIDDVIAYVRTWAPEPAAPVSSQPPPVAAGKVVLNPDGKAPNFTLKEDRFVAAADVKAALDQKRRLIIVDARTPADWQRGHIPGAISAPYYDLALLDVVPDDGTWVLAYCACPHHASGIVVDELRKRGFEHTAVIDEGINFWHNQGYPMEGADVDAGH
ncbi:MAG: c-type cytochrome [Kofleriaceae bacterium]|nr:c-type cytochrome [Kofleriaceae bacterium]MCB9571409.1 c-type cytochrome [Kofleriaceae bacterium]